MASQRSCSVGFRRFVSTERPVGGRTDDAQLCLQNELKRTRERKEQFSQKMREVRDEYAKRKARLGKD